MRLSVMILAAVLAMVASPGYAQVGGGAKVGVNFANLNIAGDDAFEELDAQTGLVVGGFVEAPITEHISIQPEVLFSQKGAKAEDGDDEYRLNLNFIQIPVLLKARFGSGPARGFVVFGPGFGFRTSANATVDALGEEFEEDIEDEVAVMDFSGIIGAGVEIGNAIVEARYDHGFNNLNDPTDSSDETKVKSRTFTVLFGLRFGGR